MLPNITAVRPYDQEKALADPMSIRTKTRPHARPRKVEFLPNGDILIVWDNFAGLKDGTFLYDAYFRNLLRLKAFVEDPIP